MPSFSGSISSNARRADCTTPLRSTIHPLVTFALSRSSSSPRRSADKAYTPARFEIEESQQSGTPVIDATVKLGRLSSDIKALMKQWKGAARLTAITATQADLRQRRCVGAD